MEITRRQLLGAGLGLTGAGLLGACSTSSTGFSLLQSATGRRVTSGRTATARYPGAVARGSLLVAVVSRTSSSVLAPTVGQVSDDQGNHWKQAVEYFTGDHYGVDVWYCESAVGGGRPTVSAVGLGYPVQPGITGMAMALLEYRGATGFELCDQICQADIRRGAVTATTNFALRSDHELAVSAVVGDMTAATVPAGWHRRVADSDQRWYVADNLDTGSSSRGRRLTAGWTGLSGGTAGAAVVATFVPRGVTSGTPRLVQSSYTDSAILPAGAGHAAWPSQPFPVAPAAGNTLMAFMNGSIYHPEIDCGSVVAVTDSTGGVWEFVADSGPDNHTGINISCWMCPSAVGGPTALTVHFSNDSQQLACLLLEFADLPSPLTVQSLATRTFGTDRPPLRTPQPVSAGDIAFAFRTSIYVFPEGPGTPQWQQIMSDTTGANCLMMLDTPPGPLTASWTGTVVGGGIDELLVALTPHAGGSTSGTTSP